MRFDGLRLSGIGPFRELVEVDLSAISGMLIAVTGNNGEGKSTLLEALGGSLYRKTPTRGSLASLATSRDAFVESRFTNGSSYVIRHGVDAVSGEGDSVVIDAAGKPAFDSAKRGAFDKWAAKHLPPREVVYSSIFAAQGSGGFLDLKAGARKAVVLRVLGIERLEALAKAARVHAQEAKVECAKLRGQIDALGAADLDAAAAELVSADDAVTLARAEIVAARARDERVRAYVQVRDRIAPLRRQLDDLTERRANNAMVLGEAEKIRAAVQRREALEVEIRGAEEAARAARTAADRATAAWHAGTWEFKSISDRGVEIERRLEAARSTLDARGEVDTAAAALPEKRRLLAEGEEAERAHRAAVETLQSSMVGRAENRIGSLRSHLVGIRDSVRADSRARARTALAEDDETARLISDGPQELLRRRTVLVENERSLRALRAEVADLERVAAKAEKIALAEQALALAETDRAAHVAALEERGRQLESERALSVRTEAEASAASTALHDLKVEYEGLAATARRVGILDLAEGRIAELDPQIATMTAELTKLEAVPVEEERDHLGPAEAALAACQARRERAALALERGREDAAKRAERAVELVAAEAELADWVRLGDDLGRDGLQAALIDCAAPELNELVNDLLHTCVGPRFTVKVEASRLSADGDREVSGLEVSILDTVKGREGPAETFSGGERVIIGEALSLGLAMLACRQSGARDVTLVRDESGAALDAANGRAWIHMLRRAAEIVHASHVLFVTFVPELAELADARLVVADGKVTVQ